MTYLDSDYTCEQFVKTIIAEKIRFENSSPIGIIVDQIKYSINNSDNFEWVDLALERVLTPIIRVLMKDFEIVAMYLTQCRINFDYGSAFETFIKNSDFGRGIKI